MVARPLSKFDVSSFLKALFLTFELLFSEKRMCIILVFVEEFPFMGGYYSHLVLRHLFTHFKAFIVFAKNVQRKLLNN